MPQLPYIIYSITPEFGIPEAVILFGIQYRRTTPLTNALCTLKNTINHKTRVISNEEEEVQVDKWRKKEVQRGKSPYARVNLKEKLPLIIIPNTLHSYTALLFRCCL